MKDSQANKPKRLLYFLESADGKTFAMDRLANGGIGVRMFATPRAAMKRATERGDAVEWSAKRCDPISAHEFLKNAQAQGVTHVIAESENPGKLKVAPIASTMLAIDLLPKQVP